jgi:NADP-dependent 3-hydroxy acid dehydrogenase YdfG
MGLLEGKVALVTGAGSGIGKAIALALAGEGATLALAGRREANLAETKAAIEAKGGKAVAFRLDVVKHDDAAKAIAAIKASLGPVDILVNNAGHSSRVRNIRFMSEAEWRAIVDLNLTAVFSLTQAALPDMLAKKAGTIVTIASYSGLNGTLLGGAAYGAAKAGVINLMGFVHNTFRNQGIRATAVVPGEADTPIMERRPQKPSDEERATMLAPEDVAQAVRLCATLPARATIPELRILPTYQRDLSADLEAARWIGAPADTPDLPKGL